MSTTKSSKPSRQRLGATRRSPTVQGTPEAKPRISVHAKSTRKNGKKKSSKTARRKLGSNHSDGQSRPVEPVTFYLHPGVENWIVKQRYPKARLDRDLDSSYYFIVHILPTREVMYRRHLQIHGRPEQPKYAPIHEADIASTDAYVMPRRVEVVRPRKMSAEKFAIYQRASTRLLGFVLFHRQHLTTEIVCHESVHVATEYLRRLRCSLSLEDKIGDHEEILAYTVGLVMNQLVYRLQELGIWK